MVLPALLADRTLQSQQAASPEESGRGIASTAATDEPAVLKALTAEIVAALYALRKRRRRLRRSKELPRSAQAWQKPRPASERSDRSPTRCRS